MTVFDTSMTLLANGFEFLEGPTWLPSAISTDYLPGTATGALLFNDIPASKTHWWSDGRVGVLRNLTNEAYRNFSADLSSFLGTTIHFIGEPRTYGMSVDVEF